MTAPISIRFNEEDHVILEALRTRTGLTVPGVLRLAIREMRDRDAARFTITGTRPKSRAKSNRARR